MAQLRHSPYEELKILHLIYMMADCLRLLTRWSFFNLILGTKLTQQEKSRLSSILVCACNVSQGNQESPSGDTKGLS